MSFSLRLTMPRLMPDLNKLLASFHLMGGFPFGSHTFFGARGYRRVETVICRAAFVVRTAAVSGLAQTVLDFGSQTAGLNHTTSWV